MSVLLMQRLYQSAELYSTLSSQQILMQRGQQMLLHGL